MQSRTKTAAKLIARLAGVAFGLALALFLFTAVAAGHSYRSAAPARAARASHAQVVRVSYDRPRYFRRDMFRFHFRHERFHFRRERFRFERDFDFSRCCCEFGY